MKNEKILSNEELLNITAGSTFLSNDDIEVEVITIPTLKYGIPVSEPIYTEPIYNVLYAVRPIKSNN